RGRLSPPGFSGCRPRPWRNRLLALDRLFPSKIPEHQGDDASGDDVALERSRHCPGDPGLGEEVTRTVRFRRRTLGWLALLLFLGLFGAIILRWISLERLRLRLQELGPTIVPLPSPEFFPTPTPWRTPVVSGR